VRIVSITISGFRSFGPEPQRVLLASELAAIVGPKSPGDKLTGDFGNESKAISISDLGLLRLLTRKLSPVNFGLLQQNLPKSDHPGHSILRRCSIMAPSGKMRLFGQGLIFATDRYR
jgi:hypothetical protein